MFRKGAKRGIHPIQGPVVKKEPMYENVNANAEKSKYRIVN